MSKYLASYAASFLTALGGAWPALAAPNLPPSVKCNDLDFLIGEWNAVTHGAVVGKVKWEAGPSHCFLEEHWNGQNGSPNFLAIMAYSAEAHNWGYFAASPGGIRERWAFGLWTGDELRFEMTEPGPEEEHFSYFKLPDGTIRELDVSTKDGGQTWTTNYDVHWTRIDDKSK